MLPNDKRESHRCRWMTFWTLAVVLLAPVPCVSGDDVLNGYGVSIAGAEFGTEKATFSNANPGVFQTDYIYPDEATIGQLANRGIRLMRVPFRWERLQPTLAGPLDRGELLRLQKTIDTIGNHGCLAILDLHNYGRYCLATRNGKKELIIDQVIEGIRPVTADHLADLWQRLAKTFADQNFVAAYGLMNEPHDMGNSDWKSISQKAVTAIRSVDVNKMILIAGDDWSSAERFAISNGSVAWIADPTGNFAYEAHCYLDSDASGKYRLSFANEFRLDQKIANRAEQRLAPFVSWCTKNRVRGFVGEFGVPANDPDWNRLLDAMLQTMQRSNLSGTAWAAGPWWNDYSLSLEPSNASSKDSLSLQLLRQFSTYK